MNAILAALHKRKSVRAYLDRPISEEDKRAALLAACAAPSTGNQQLYTILDITDQELKDKLAVSCDNQPFIYVQYHQRYQCQQPCAFLLPAEFLVKKCQTDHDDRVEYLRRGDNDV